MKIPGLVKPGIFTYLGKPGKTSGPSARLGLRVFLIKETIKGGDNKGEDNKGGTPTLGSHTRLKYIFWSKNA